MPGKWNFAAPIEGLKQNYLWKYSNKAISTNILYKREGGRKVYNLTEFPSVRMMLALEAGDTVPLESIFVNKGTRSRTTICRDCNTPMKLNGACQKCSSTLTLKRKREAQAEEKKLAELKIIEMDRARQTEKRVFEEKLNADRIKLEEKIKTLLSQNTQLKQKSYELKKVIEKTRKEKEKIERVASIQSDKICALNERLVDAEKEKDKIFAQMSQSEDAMRALLVEQNARLQQLIIENVSIEVKVTTSFQNKIQTLIQQDMLLTISRMAGTWQAAQGMLLPHQRKLATREYPSIWLEDFKAILPAGNYDFKKLASALTLPQNTVKYYMHTLLTKLPVKRLLKSWESHAKFCSSQGGKKLLEGAKNANFSFGKYSEESILNFIEFALDVGVHRDNKLQNIDQIFVLKTLNVVYSNLNYVTSDLKIGSFAIMLTGTVDHYLWSSSDRLELVRSNIF